MLCHSISRQYSQRFQDHPLPMPSALPYNQVHLTVYVFFKSFFQEIYIYRFAVILKRSLQPDLFININRIKHRFFMAFQSPSGKCAFPILLDSFSIHTGLPGSKDKQLRNILFSNCSEEGCASSPMDPKALPL